MPSRASLPSASPRATAARRSAVLASLALLAAAARAAPPCAWPADNACHFACSLHDIQPASCTVESKVCGWCSQFGTEETCSRSMMTFPGKLELADGASVVRRCVFADGKCILSDYVHCTPLPSPPPPPPPAPPPRCSLVKRLPLAGVGSLVRSRQNTAGSPAQGLLPACAAAAAGGCVEEECAGAAGAQGVGVRFNSRSYLLAGEQPRCDGRAFGEGEYGCVDYAGGALSLGGKTLSFEIDLSRAGCGCNAALYLVSMPQNDQPSECGDFYCDANNVCGVSCAEIDLMEANSVAFVSTVHVADDANGDGFGQGHYVIPKQKRLLSDSDCSYGPSAECAIDTQLPFHVAIDFSRRGEPFGFNVTLRQRGKVARYGPVRYTAKPTKGSVPTEEAANANLRERLDAGMTLVTSYWAGIEKKDMAWLDAPCKPDEVSEWRCTDAFVEHPTWPWQCANDDTAPPACADAFHLTALDIAPTPPPLPPPPQQLQPSKSLVMLVGLFLVVLGGVCAAFATNRLGRSLFEFQSVSIAPEKADDASEDEMVAPKPKPSRKVSRKKRQTTLPLDAPTDIVLDIEVKVTIPDTDFSAGCVLVLETASGACVHVPLADDAAPGDQLSFSLPEDALAALSSADIDDLCKGRMNVTVSTDPDIQL